LEFIDTLLADNKNIFAVAECVEGGLRCPNPTQKLSKAANKWPAFTLHLAEAILGYIYMKFYRPANNPSKDADGISNSLIDDRDVHIRFPLIMFTCTTSRHAFL